MFLRHPTKEAFTIAHKGACKPKAETMDKRSGKIMCEQLVNKLNFFEIYKSRFTFI